MNRSIAADAVKISISKMSVVTISMITVFLLSRFRTLEEYGTYSQILMVSNIVTTFFMLGLPNSINYFLAKAESVEEKRRFLSTYFSLNTAISFITGGLLVLSVPFVVRYFNNELIKNFVYVFAVYPWTTIILSAIDNICIVYHKTNMLIGFRIANGISLLLIILIVEIWQLGFAAYMELFIAVQSIFAVCVYIIVGNFTTKLKVTIEKQLVVDILKFSIPLGFASVLGTISIFMGTLFIGKYFNTEQLAIYANAAREMPVTLIASSITAVLMPRMVQLLVSKKCETAISLWRDSISLSYAFICFIAAGLFTYAPDVISLLYSDKYLPGVTIFRIYNILLLLRCTYFGIVLNSFGKTRLIFYSSIASLVLNIIFMFVFYYIFGYIGPAVATLLSTGLVALFQLKATAICAEMKLSQVFPWKNICIITLVNIIMGLIFTAAKWMIPAEQCIGEIAESIFLGAVWALLYAVVMMSFIKKKWDVLNEKY